MYQSNYLANQLSNASKNNKQSVFAVLNDDSEITYDSLFKSAEQVAAALVEAGLKPGDRVAAQVEKSITTIHLYLGSVIAGGVFLPLNTDYTPSEVEYFLVDASPTVFICDPSKEDALSLVANKAQVTSLLTLSKDGLEGSFVDAIFRQKSGFEAVPRNADDLAAILYTSGTTGRSKGAMLTHKALASNAQTLAKIWHFTSSDRLIHALPIFHTHGLFVAINVTLSAGSSMYLLPKFDADRILDLFSNATVLMGVPTFYVRLLKSKNLNQDKVQNMRLFISGSAPLLSETHAQWLDKTGHAILERYGMTETNMNTSNPYVGERRPGTVGRPLPDVEVKITHPDTGETLPVDGIGHIQVRIPNVFSGYWKMPEKTAEELSTDGWFLTGDIGVLDKSGYLSIVGRSKDLIISGGYNVYPKEVELVIDEVPNVIESAVIGVPHPDFGEAVVAVVITKGEVTEEAIKIATKQQLAGYKQPKKIIFLDELPRNTMGKVQKIVLRESHKNLFS
ncbi:malonyl-CoA synthase [Marinomonas sp. GJ51-6]|uniref:malonate--CoA ligase n=1 Tax=Marinomonas sp. GJ51-6 TaxID=2992802 RepID=UPI0029346B63|nr:malonyl-CoA synthase [Marinomonas sp. GJ51-6]WOD07521.1 malonyl-CoA synthase [Marinomonas sp. GJ51-6]